MIRPDAGQLLHTVVPDNSSEASGWGWGGYYYQLVKPSSIEIQYALLNEFGDCQSLDFHKFVFSFVTLKIMPHAFEVQRFGNNKPRYTFIIKALAGTFLLSLFRHGSSVCGGNFILKFYLNLN